MTTELYGTLALAVGAGAATFFAPCSYALLPGYVGYYVAATEGEHAPLAGAATRGVAAAVGVLGTFVVLAGVAVAASGFVERVLHTVELLVGGLLIAFGIAVLAGKTGSLHVALPERRASVTGFALFGALYAFAATACVLPVFLGVALQATTLSPAGTAAVLGAYGGVVAVLMLAVTVATALGRSSGIGEAVGPDRLVSAAGALLVLAGIGQLYVALTVS